MSHHNFGSVLGPVASSAMPSGGPQIIREEQALGLKAIYAACRILYPDQPTPLQVTALRKFWMGGPDPLDFINMYSNPGSPELGSPAHWHYVTNGLSDLYGDSRLHSQCTSTDDPSGFGFELTLRVRRDPSELNPPTWPAHLLQSLARYVFHSQAQLMVGDHIPWPSALDKPPSAAQNSTNFGRSDTGEADAQSIAMAAAATAASFLASKSGGLSPATGALSNPSTYASMVAAALAAVNSTNKDRDTTRSGVGKSTKADSGSRIRHMLLIEDPQLKRITTPYGYVQFLQLVGLCDEELRLVQRWTGSHVAELMRRLPDTGGGLLVTDMRRKLSLFELEPQLFDYVNEHLRREGSNLSGVTTQYFAWAPISLSTLAELLPGEAEARRLQQSVKHPTRSDHMSSSAHATVDRLCQSTQRADDSCLPTDLSMPRSSEPGSRSQHSPGPTAMDTDETVVSSSAVTRKPVDDDEFVDVVGDSGPPSVLDSKNPSTDLKDTNRVRENVPSTSDDPVGSAGEVSSGTSLTHSASKMVDTQSTSAPGGFSPWCGRLDSTGSRNQAGAILLPDDFLERLEFQFSCLMYPDDLQLPLVFRWPERHLRICLVDPSPKPHPAPNFYASTGEWNTNPLLPKAMALSIPDAHATRDGTGPSTDSSILTPNKQFPRTTSMPSSGAQEHMNSPTNLPALCPSTLSLFPPGFIPPPPPVLAAMLTGPHVDQRPIPGTQTAALSAMQSHGLSTMTYPGTDGHIPGMRYPVPSSNPPQ
ncbi:unnamed protein product [Echinostoma caproni]|uniref:Suppressor of fused homolog n=1 Tax=Echinostoma caproni TaxID=27848 RepID=A0A183ARW7_9TREM|nr:unnamed protein product [Echinostoma caproni]